MGMVKKNYRSLQPRRETSAGSFQCEAPALNFFWPEPSGALFLFELRFFEVEHDLEPP
jgi:hypothetical protein